MSDGAGNAKIFMSLLAINKGSYEAILLPNFAESSNVYVTALQFNLAELGFKSVILKM